MPRRKFVSSMRTICLRNIAQNMDNLWCADYTKNFLDKGNFLYLVGPFDCLTSSHIEELLSILCETRLMKRYYLHLLIDNRLTSLNLSVCKLVANKDSIINLVTVRCQKMQRLNIALCNAVSARVLADLVNSCRYLQQLNLQRTKCNDQVLALIGLKCRHLRELNVSGCPVTDMGVMSLCVTFDPSHVKCEKLYRLDISSTAVTCKGAQVAASNLPQLAYLIFPDICDVIYRIRENYADLQSIPVEQQLKLRYLTLSEMKTTSAPIYESVRLSVAVCPQLTEIHFTRAADNRCVLELSQLDNLRVLHIGNSDEELITFDDGLLPLLQLRGSQLEDLSLHEVNNIDLGCVGACCPQLKRFSCIVAGYPTATFPIHSHPEIITAHKHVPFTQLESVKVLLHTSQTTFPPQYVKILLLKAHRLRYLHLAFIQSLDDTVLDFILEENHLERLEDVYLESCNQLSGDGIQRLIDSCDVLKSLVLKYCNEITRQDYSRYCKLCQENNYQMNIEWM